MKKVRSRDGTHIAVDKSGYGRAIVLVGGALSDRSGAATLAALLAPSFTVYTYDRRGRGDSEDTAPYSVQREVEDLAAVIFEAGDAAYVYGHSSGAVLALEAVERGLPIPKLAVYEPPLIVDASRQPVPAGAAATVAELVASGRRGDAVEWFLTKAVDSPPDVVAQLKQSKWWPGMEAMAHTIEYDLLLTADVGTGSLEPLEKWTRLLTPTLVMDGGASPVWIRTGAQSLARALGNATYRTLEGQTHGPDAQMLATALTEFLAEAG